MFSRSMLRPTIPTSPLDESDSPRFWKAAMPTKIARAKRLRELANRVYASVEYIST